MIYTRRDTLTAFAAALAATGAPVLAASHPAYFPRGRYVIRGYGPIAYFAEGALRKGSTKYEPAFGGYCAYAMSRGGFGKDTNKWPGAFIREHFT